MTDEIDKCLLRLLQADGKSTIKELAGKLNLTTTPVYERIKRLEKGGVIKSYRATVDRKKIGLSLMVFANISLQEHHSSQIAKFQKDILQFPEVIACYHIAGMFDYLVHALVRDMEAYQQFVTTKLASLENIGKVQSSFVMTEVKALDGIPIP